METMRRLQIQSEEEAQTLRQVAEEAGGWWMMAGHCFVSRMQFEDLY